MNKSTMIAQALALAVVAQPLAFAGDFDDVAQNLANEKIQAWVSDPRVVLAVRAQNARNSGLSEAEIVALDNKWRAGDAELKKSVLNNDVSSYLSDVKQGGGGLYTEIFVMDNKGLNVGQSDETSDYWQGDEAKWQETYLKGADAIHVSDVEEDESTQTFQVQVSVPVVDKGEVIGAVTTGVDVERLQ